MDEPDMKGVGKHCRQRELQRQKQQSLDNACDFQEQWQPSPAGRVIGIMEMNLKQQAEMRWEVHCAPYLEVWTFCYNQQVAMGILNED